MTGRHHADLIDDGERFRVAPVEHTPASFPGKHATPHDQAVAVANAAIQEAARIVRDGMRGFVPPPPLPPRERRKGWWFA